VGIKLFTFRTTAVLLRMGVVTCLLKIIGSIRCLSERILPKYYYIIQVVVSVYFARVQDLF